MGHSLHGLYTVDFTTPKFAWDSVVLMADTYGSYMFGCVQTQFIDHVQFEETPQRSLLVRVNVRHGRVDLPPEAASSDERFLPQPRLSAHEIDFRLEGDVFEVTPPTAAAARLFHVR